VDDLGRRRARRLGFVAGGVIGLITALEPAWAFWGLLPGAGVMAMGWHERISATRRPRAALREATRAARRARRTADDHRNLRGP
jgi:hypothetical protein